MLNTPSIDVQNKLLEFVIPHGVLPDDAENAIAFVGVQKTAISAISNDLMMMSTAIKNIYR